MTAPVGVVGLGRMGRAIATRLLSQGHPVTVYNRTTSACQAFASLGASIAATPALAAKGGLVITSVTGEDALSAVCHGPDGFVQALRGGVHLSMSTLAPTAAEHMARLHRDAGVSYVSTPVQGRPMMAEAGQLVAWVSGAALSVPAERVLASIARKVVHLGDDARSAAAAKLALNMLMNANIELFAEAFAYVAGAGVDTRVFGEGLTETAFAAPLFKAIVASLAKADEQATGSDVSISRKDLGLLVSDSLHVELPIARALEQVFAEAQARGWGHLDPVAVRRVFSKSEPVSS